MRPCSTQGPSVGGASPKTYVMSWTPGEVVHGVNQACWMSSQWHRVHQLWVSITFSPSPSHQTLMRTICCDATQECTWIQKTKQASKSEKRDRKKTQQWISEKFIHFEQRCHATHSKNNICWKDWEGEDSIGFQWITYHTIEEHRWGAARRSDWVPSVKWSSGGSFGGRFPVPVSPLGQCPPESPSLALLT